MIPQFPEFKKIELSDKHDIEDFAAKYDPYSDFNFINLWSWDLHNSARASFLNGNLVLNITDHRTQQEVYSYLGNNDLTDTLSRLFDHLNNRQQKPGRLSLIPEISLHNINFYNYYIEIDIDSCDYIYELSSLSSLSGNKYTQKRGRVNNFKSHYPDAEIKILTPNDLDKDFILETSKLNQLWINNKEDGFNKLDYEIQALSKFLEGGFTNTVCIAVYLDKLIGYAFYSFHRQDNVMNHFIKADIGYKGIYEFMIQESSKIFYKQGYKFLNYQEDMGIPGLRQAKMAYRPVNFLRKYYINKL